MKKRSQNYFSLIIRMNGLGGIMSLLLAGMVFAQAVPYARTYLKSKVEVDSALKEMQAYSGQKLPIVEGFVAAGGKPLDQFERAFYEYSIDLLPGTSAGTIVRVSAKITAWYADKDPAKSGYQVLPSNGRLELDLLDRLDDKFGGQPASSSRRGLSNSTINSPKPNINLAGIPSVAHSAPANPAPNSEASGSNELDSLRTKRDAAEKRMQELSIELQTLQDIKKNQARPSNLVVVKKPGTPVLAKPEPSAGPLFSAAEDDEFEFIGAEGEWIHVRISGPSRGYIRRSSVELPELIAMRLKSPNAAPSEETPLTFRIAREENSPFPGNWEMLRGKVVKIYTLQPVALRETSAPARLKFAASLFQKFSADSARMAPEVEGVVIVFDSADGGMIGATLGNIREMASGSLSLDNFWKQCYLEPPEAFQPLPNQ